MSVRTSAFFTTALVVLAMAQAACTPIGIAAGAGATAGVAAASDGGISGAVSDLKIKTAINDLWFKRDLEMFRKLNLTVDQGRVLITGVVQNPEHRVEAVRLAWQPQGVKQVINEIRVADSDGVEGYVTDSWITAQLRTKMTLDRDIQSINYSIDTVQGIVYLMGTAQSQMELNHVIETARSIKHVTQVVSYVKMRNETVPSQPLAPGMAPAPITATGTNPGTTMAPGWTAPDGGSGAPVQMVPMTPAIPEATGNPASVTSATLPP